MSDAVVISVRTGRVRTLDRPEWDHHSVRTWRTAYRKDEVEGPVAVGPLGIEGDEVFSTDVHGGVQMAVLAYAFAHYPAWRAELGLSDFGPGAFGENLTIDGLDERSVCIGDVYAVGDVRVQVSQPRGPCSNISRFWNVPTLLKRVAETHRTGWYLRVLQPGRLERGQVIRRLEQPHPDYPIDRLLRARLHPQSDRVGLGWLAACEALSPEWRAMYAHHAQRLAESDSAE